MSTGHVLPFEDHHPRIHPTAWVAPTAVVVGEVEIGEAASVWYNCVVRGDGAPVRIGARSNVQDGTVVHITVGIATTIGADVTIGHGCVIHACVLRDRAFVGMGATVLDGAVIEEGGMLGAGGLLAPGKRIGPGELWLGAPARLARVMDEADRVRFSRNAPHYVDLARRHRATLAQAGLAR